MTGVQRAICPECHQTAGNQHDADCSLKYGGEPIRFAVGRFTRFSEAELRERSHLSLDSR